MSHPYVRAPLPRAVSIRLRIRRLQRLKPPKARHLLPHNVTPARLLRVAVLGDADGETMGSLRESRPPPNSSQALVRELMTLSGNPPYASLLEMLLARDNSQSKESQAIPSSNRTSGPQRTAQLSNDASHGYDPIGRRAISSTGRDLFKLLLSASSMEELVRVVVWLMDGPDGHRLAPDLALWVEPAAVALRPGTGFTDFVVAMNSIAGVFRRHSVPLPVSFYSLAIKCAAISHQTAAVRQFLMDCRQYRHRFSIRDTGSITHKIAYYSEKIPGPYDAKKYQRRAGEVGMRFGAWRRHDALRLLTGWRTAGVPGQGETRDVCMQEFMQLDDLLLACKLAEEICFCGGSNSVIRLWHDLPDNRRVENWRRQRPRLWTDLSPRAKLLVCNEFQDLPFRHPKRAASRLSTILYFITRALIRTNDSRAALDLALDNVQFFDCYPPNCIPVLMYPRNQRYLEDFARLSLAITDRFGYSASAKYFRRFARAYLPEPLARHFDDLASTTMEQSLISIERCLGLEWNPGFSNKQGGLHFRAEALKVS